MENAVVTEVGPEKAVIKWDSDPMQTSYELEFRLAGEEEGVWHKEEIFQAMATISRLLRPDVEASK